MTPHAQAEAVVKGCTHAVHFGPGSNPQPPLADGACAACLTTALQAQARRDADISRHVSVLADKEKACCGEIPEKVLREEIAVAIESAAGLG